MNAQLKRNADNRIDHNNTHADEVKIGGNMMNNTNKPVKMVFVSNDLITDWTPIAGLSNDTSRYLHFHKMMREYDEEEFDGLSFRAKDKTVRFNMMIYTD